MSAFRCCKTLRCLTGVTCLSGLIGVRPVGPLSAKRWKSALCGREVNAEDCTPARLGGDLNKSAVVSNNSPNRCQAETGAFFRRFGGKKWFKNFIEEI